MQADAHKAVIDYKLLYADKPNELQTAVREALAKGWQPQGGVQVERVGYNHGFYQAMVLYPEAT